ncbi:MAG: N-acetylglutaminylglutamine amidotransferase [Gammaproteobacteria bacterium]|nr:N-acetylglutaminylglutamine amidotransferase [Gammaproteobacteria bacterium]
MCGICGELSWRGQSPSEQSINNMLVHLERRGPDDQGVYINKQIGLGHRRLSIIDLTSASHQPMRTANKSMSIVFNGTIYNYPQLRQQLQARGVQFSSSGDTEVILKAYELWGEQCLEKLIGMFAFAIWDERKKKLFVARDRLGIKPFYYSQTDDSFLFASNTQALLATGKIDTDIDTQALQHQFTLHAVVPAPRTILKSIRKLAPGHFMWVDVNGVGESKAYWELSARRKDEKDEQEWIEQIQQALQLAVDRRLEISDVPVGVLLSGGLDSSLLVGLLAQKHGQVNTYSVGFEDQPEERGNEFEYSDAVVERFSTNHQRFHIANDQVLTRLPEAIRCMPEPMVAQDAVAFYLLAEQVSKDIKVVQSGQGADEVFAGYFWYPKMHAAQGSYIQRFSSFYFDRDFDEYAKTVNVDYVQQDFTSQLVSEALEKSDSDTFIDAVLQFDATTLIVDDPVKRVDSMTMAWGLEARVPFLDHELVELAMQMPPEMKLQDDGKYVLKKIARGLIPDAVIDRPKGYFPMPALKYVRGEFLEMVRDTLMSSACIQRGLYSRDYVDKLLAAPDQYHTRLQGSKIWHMALLEQWLQANVDTAAYPSR